MTLLHGHVLDVLKTLPDESFQCVVTSPPYWALRRYDIPDVVWGGDPDCDHEWASFVRPGQDGGPSAKQDTNAGSRYGPQQQQCIKCAAWIGQLGQEPTPDLFIAHLVEIFREVRRVLRADGTCWLNMGDCYNAYNGGAGTSSGIEGPNHPRSTQRPQMPSGYGLRDKALKPKDLVGIPWMLAFALRADGWYLRAENIWAKGLSFCESYAGSVMPESVTDRPTRSHEQVFLLTKNERYFYDHLAVKEQGVYAAGTIAAKGSGTREGNRRGGRKKDVKCVRAASTERRQGGSFQDRVDAGYACYDGARNLRTVWAIGVEPFKGAHFATFPPDLVDPCLRAGTSAKGACALCGAPWKRIVEYEPMPEEIKAQFEAARQSTAEDHGRDDGFTTRRPNYQRKRIGEHWEPTCECEDADVEPCKVLDPFAGSGTTGVAAELMRLSFTGIELGASYIEMAQRRTSGVAPLFAVEVGATGEAVDPRLSARGTPSRPRAHSLFPTDDLGSS